MSNRTAVILVVGLNESLIGDWSPNLQRFCAEGQTRKLRPVLPAVTSAQDPVVGWGANHYGQSAPPPSVDGTDGTASAIAAGFVHSCAIESAGGAAVCWGRNDFGQASPPSCRPISCKKLSHHARVSLVESIAWSGQI